MALTSRFQMGRCTWSLFVLSLVHLARGISDEKMTMSSGGGGGMGMGMGMGMGTDASFMHSAVSMETPEEAFNRMKNKYDADKKNMMASANAIDTHGHSQGHTHMYTHGHGMELMKMGDKNERKKHMSSATRKGRGKKGDKKMQMMYLGLMYIKSVIQMVMMAIGQVLQFKSVVISLVSVLIQVAQFVMMLKQKHAWKGHGYHSGKLAPVETPGWSGASSYDHGGSSEIVEDGGLGTYAGYRYDQGNVNNSPDLTHNSYNNYGTGYKH